MTNVFIQTVLSWTKLNPEYDYLLFDDNAVDLFAKKEFGNDVFDALRSVNVEAAKWNCGGTS